MTTANNVERNDLVTFKGNPITLVGTAPTVGAKAPAFVLNKSLMETVSLSDFSSKVLILTAAPSVDTGICALQLRAFNERAAELGDDVAILYVTLDLPFALGRFCGAEGIERVVTASDYKSRAFAADYGLMMKELGLLARSTFVIDREGVVRYAEIVGEMTHEPDYDAALAAARAAL